MNKNARPKTVMETILEWSGRRPLWQQDALRRIVSKGTAGRSVNSGNTLSLQEGTRIKDIKIEAVPLEAVHLPANPGDGASITLERISDIVGVNQWAPQQTLVFETGGLTVIYGPNGAGKSGYGRILKRAA